MTPLRVCVLVWVRVVCVLSPSLPACPPPLPLVFPPYPTLPLALCESAHARIACTTCA
jgi:hypothetical protein